MIFDSLHESAQRGELLLVDGGMCHWHLRRDGQLTIREIISTKKGAGSQMLNRLKSTIGAKSLFAKCPAELSANDWYAKKGFSKEAESQTKSGKTLIHWRMALESQGQRHNLNNFELIYCAAGNQRFAEIAIDNGWLYGAQMPNKIYYRPYFVDQNWHKPDFDSYMLALQTHRPALATVLDWEHEEQFGEVMKWATEAAKWVETVIIIPKVPGLVDWIPDCINENTSIRLGYSVPTKYADTPCQLAEFGDRPVHLLGGSPQTQMRLSRVLNVKSADCNYHQKMATKYCQYYAHNVFYATNRFWPTLRESDGGWPNDAPYEAFRRSTHNIKTAWQKTLQIPKANNDKLQLRLAL